MADRVIRKIGDIINGFELIGKTVRHSKIGNRYSCYIVKCCDCGAEYEWSISNLTRGNKCVCQSKRQVHGKSNTRLYRIWAGMKDRINNPKSWAYKYYGGRGITVCEEWQNDFQAFYDWAMASGYREDLTIDREDVNGNYEPSNCRWITNAEQQKNTRREIHYITYNGETLPMKQIAEKYGVNYHTLQTRLLRGWSIERALESNQSISHTITYQGKTQSIAEWAKEYGIKYKTLHQRLSRNNWDMEKALINKKTK